MGTNASVTALRGKLDSAQDMQQSITNYSNLCKITVQ